MSTVYVNGKWTDESVFNADSNKPADAVWGENVFSDFAEAYAAVENGGTLSVYGDTVFSENKIGTAANTWAENVNTVVTDGTVLTCQYGADTQFTKGSFTISAGGTVTGVSGNNYYFKKNFAMTGTAEKKAVFDGFIDPTQSYIDLHTRWGGSFTADYADITAGMLYNNASGASVSNSNIYAALTVYWQSITVSDSEIEIRGVKYGNYTGANFLSGTKLVNSTLTSGSGWQRQDAATGDVINGLTLDNSKAYFLGDTAETVKSLTITGANASAEFDGGAVISTLNVSNSAKVVFKNNSEIVRNKTVSISSNASVEFEDLMNNGTLNLSGGAEFFASSFVNSSTVKITADSKLTAETFSTAGSVIIDAEDFYGVNKVIESSGTSSLEGKVTLVNAADGIKLFYGSDGDVLIGNVDTGTVYFNNNWTDYSFGDEIEAGQIYGINAFNKFDTSGVNTEKGWSNLLVLPANTSEIVLNAGNENASYGMLRPTQDITVYTSGEGYAVIDRFVNVTGDLVFAENSKVKVLTAAGFSGANNQGGSITVNGELYLANAGSSYKALYLWGMNNTPGQLIVNAGGKLITEAGNIENHGTITVFGTVEIGSAGDAPKLAGVGANNGGWNGHLIVDGSEGEGIFSVAHNRVNFGGGNTSLPWQDAPSACTVTIKNGAEFTTGAVYFRNGIENTLTVENSSFVFAETEYSWTQAAENLRYFDNYGTINISDSTFDIYEVTGRTFVNYGTVNFTNSSFDDVINNQGDIYLRGTVTVDADAFTGKAAAADSRSVLNITGWDFTAEGAALANINANVSQIKSVNGQDVFTFDNEVYFINTDNVLYNLGYENSQVTVSKGHADMTVSVTVEQTPGTYEFNFSAEAAGNLGDVTYFLIINGEEIASGKSGSFSWTNDAYAQKLTDFTYSVSAADSVGQIAVESGTFSVKDYTAPVITNAVFVTDADFNNILTFDVSDNGTVKSVTVNGQNAVYSDGKYTFSDFGTSKTYIISVEDAAGNTSRHAGIVEKVVEKDAAGNINVASSGNSTQSVVNIGKFKSSDTVGQLYIGSNAAVSAELISADPGKSIQIVVSMNSNLIVADTDSSKQDMTSVSNFATGGQVQISAAKYIATEYDDSFSLGMDGTAEFTSFDMLEGNDTVYVGVNAVFTVNGNMANVEKFTVATGGIVKIADYTTDNGLIKIGMNAEFTADTISGVNEMSVNSNAVVQIDSIVLNKLNVGSSAKFNVETLDGTINNDVFTFSTNSESIFETLAFGGGSGDRLVMNSGASLLITGEVSGLERISGNKSNTIYTVDADMFDGIAGMNLVNIVEIKLEGFDYAAICEELAAQDMDEYFKSQLANIV